MKPEVKVLSVEDIEKLDIMLAPYPTPVKVIEITGFCHSKKIKGKQAFVAYYYYPNLNIETFVMFCRGNSYPNAIKEEEFPSNHGIPEDKKKFEAFCDNFIGMKSKILRLVEENIPQ